MAEVLDRQSPGVRVLLRTSIVRRLTGPLCDALVDGTNSARLLVELERANLFLVALDQRRQWYRYHQLFGDLLRYELSLTLPVTSPRCTAGRPGGICATGWWRRRSPTRWPRVTTAWPPS